MTEQKELTRKDIKPTLKQKFEGAAIKTENLFDITTKVPAFVAAGVVASIFGPLVNTYNQIIKIGENAINNEGFCGKDFIDAMRSYVDNIEPYNRAAWKNVEKNIVDVLKQAQNRYKEYDHKVYVEPIEMAKRKKEKLEEREKRYIEDQQKKQAQRQYSLSPDRMKATGAETLESMIKNATNIKKFDSVSKLYNDYPPLKGLNFRGKDLTEHDGHRVYLICDVGVVLYVIKDYLGALLFKKGKSYDFKKYPVPVLDIADRYQANYLEELVSKKASELGKERQTQTFLKTLSKKLDSNAK
ncbi:MAG: hypothetical protein J6R99_02505 [Alphaproteobacteria bacterium]|nr:hypothetical protein [Alphaproteobacteria bacterium]